MVSHTEMHLKHLVPLTHTDSDPGLCPQRQKKTPMGVPSSALLRNTELQTQNTHTHSELRIPWSMALYLQATMPQGHKADHYSFETWSTTRPLHPWLLTYIPLILNIGHKTSCLYLFILFYPPLCAVNHRNLNNPYTLETTFLSRKKKDNWVTRAAGQQLDSSTNHTPILWSSSYRLLKHLLSG